MVETASKQPRGFKHGGLPGRAVDPNHGAAMRRASARPSLHLVQVQRSLESDPSSAELNLASTMYAKGPYPSLLMLRELAVVVRIVTSSTLPKPSPLQHRTSLEPTDT